MSDVNKFATSLISHNPYFNRWFSAIALGMVHHKTKLKSQSLF